VTRWSSWGPQVELHGEFHVWVLIPSPPRAARPRPSAAAHPARTVRLVVRPTDVFRQSVSHALLMLRRAGPP